MGQAESCYHGKTLLAPCQPNLQPVNSPMLPCTSFGSLSPVLLPANHLPIKPEACSNANITKIAFQAAVLTPKDYSKA
jgi:hypothetical protein